MGKASISTSDTPDVAQVSQVFDTPTGKTGDTLGSRSNSRPPRHWMTRLLRGAQCRWRLNRNDASPLVHSLWNFGEPFAAMDACKRVIASTPENPYAYIHLIDLSLRQFKDLGQATKYYRSGVDSLESTASLELLESFFLYTRCVHFPFQTLHSLLARRQRAVGR